MEANESEKRSTTRAEIEYKIVHLFYDCYESAVKEAHFTISFLYPTLKISLRKAYDIINNETLDLNKIK
ncbi:hypothetical protein G2W53_025540 [Senna tora]|uniref:Uncharacterized protein n=1 Tax=Senna tora TaxID=362788 RepID=A0A834WEA3_9FABA|nr:hypothetical protein G2W53_025540 [Senna tora]